MQAHEHHCFQTLIAQTTCITVKTQKEITLLTITQYSIVQITQFL